MRHCLAALAALVFAAVSSSVADARALRVAIVPAMNHVDDMPLTRESRDPSECNEGGEKDREIKAGQAYAEDQKSEENETNRSQIQEGEIVPVPQAKPKRVKAKSAKSKKTNTARKVKKVKKIKRMQRVKRVKWVKRTKKSKKV
ncbi:hypothetical protein LEN26_004645 [Aphanomyces euteiches]|nr:hypothetical protein AeMF1_006273 [Aphanomyces euteiches]KAH9147923.1 hypothetical protein LEN26_004645 [Aphanomyces euteiches]KAH9167560.1 hypothetical protein AeNC1_018127 [Aphanomyces euteiches]